LDTSVFIASESGRDLAVDLLPEASLVCVVTIGELEAGVLAAPTTEIRARRLRTAQRAAAITPLPIDAPAAAAWARLRVMLHECGRRVGANDLWIASVAASRGLPVVTQDDDFDVLAELGLVEVVRV
jgi:predicted nucleic acid-binding protein